MPKAIGRLAQKYLHDPVEVTVKSKTSTAQNITQKFLQVSHQRKLDALTRVLEVEQFDGMIVFVRTKQATEELAEKLRARGHSAMAINGDMVQAQRERDHQPASRTARWTSSSPLTSPLADSTSTASATS